MRRLAIGLGLAGNIYVEEMNFVVARNALAACIEHQRGGGDAAIGCPHGRGSRDDPQAEIASRRRHGILYWPAAVCFTDCTLICVCKSHEREVLGQRCENGAPIAGLLQQIARLLEIRGYVRTGRHLNCGNFHVCSNRATRR